jgi:hypothetical protein
MRVYITFTYHAGLVECVGRRSVAHAHMCLAGILEKVEFLLVSGIWFGSGGPACVAKCGRVLRTSGGFNIVSVSVSYLIPTCLWGLWNYCFFTLLANEY